MKRLLFIAHRVPYPPDKGERVRAFHELQVLARRFDVTLAALAHQPDDGQRAEQLKSCCRQVIVAPAGGWLGLCRAALSLALGRSATEGYFRSRRLRRRLAAPAGEGPFDLVLGYCSSTLPLVLAASARARVLDLVDVDSAKWADYADKARPLRRWLYRLEARAVARLERLALDRCDAVTLVSQAEADLLRGTAVGPAAARVTGPKPMSPPRGEVVVAGNGVDLAYFAPRPPPAPPEPSLVFTGTMDYRPNVEGVCWLARAVWPELKRKLPGLTFTIVGRDPAPEVRRLARSAGIVVTGTVPDVRPYLSRAAVAVCPLQLARGIQNKILEAMAMARPVVASPAAIEGLEVKCGQDLLQADSPQQWHSRLLELLEQPPLRERIGSAARRCVEAHYTWDQRLAPLVELCARLAEAPPGAESRVNNVSNSARLKSETRNPKSETNDKHQMRTNGCATRPKRRRRPRQTPGVSSCCLPLGVCFGFRASDFGFDGPAGRWQQGVG